jgi:hypothetical protein
MDFADISGIKHAPAQGPLWGLAHGDTRRFVLNLSDAGREVPYEQLLEPSFWAPFSGFLRWGDIVIVTSNFTVELLIGEPAREGGFVVRQLSARFSYPYLVPLADEAAA